MRLSGLGVSAGIGIGRAVVLRRGGGQMGFGVTAARVPAEIERLHAARDAAREQLKHIKARLAGGAGAEHSYLFDAQLLMLDDRMLIDRAAQIIATDRVNAESALQQTLKEISSLFDRGDDPYLRERKGDVADIVARLCGNLRASGEPSDLFRHVEGPIVLVAHELTPSLVGQLDWQRIAGLVSDEGSWTYHTAILARSIRLPAVVGLRDASLVIPPGSLLAVDGSSGEVSIDPDHDTLQQFGQRSRRRAEYRAVAGRIPASPGHHGGRHPDPARSERGVARRRPSRARAGGRGHRFVPFGVPARGRRPGGAGGGGAGTSAYRRLVASAAPATVTIRTFDVSETQLPIDHAGLDRTRAPLGLRGIRLSLALEEVFQTQIRALLRAAVHGPLRIMFPFISGVDELRAARRVVETAAEALRRRGDSVPNVPIGVMIEVPSAALTADLLAAEADFFSIGTNDLIQYRLAVDRTDDRVSGLYEPLHPAILRMVRFVARSGKRRGIRVAVCGEMAADPVLLALLVGLGLREFSMAPTAIPLAKQVLREISAADMARVAARALRAPTAAAIDVS